MTPLIIGNWKMNQLKDDLVSFFADLSKESLPFAPWIAPQSIHLPLALEVAKESGIKIGAQNCHFKTHGAYTGEISAQALKDLGVSFSLIGHSERRVQFSESNELLNKKLLTCLDEGLTVVFCVGESLEERKAHRAFDVVKKQLEEGLKDVPSNASIIIAYEPVWAIGTGLTATPQQAQDMHAFIRSLMGDFNYPIVYGGSVKSSNIGDLMAMDDIDGALVGGASLKSDSFLQILKNTPLS
jgi:triosephosphate isomerase